jgi:hypothetical protein
MTDPIVFLSYIFHCVFGSRIFGAKRDEVTGGWRKLHNDELHVLYSSPSIVRVIKQGG